MKTAAAAETCLVTPEFFERAGDMWEQLGQALEPDGQNGPGLLGHVRSEGAYAFLMATADRIFSQDLALAFLQRMREWGKGELGVRHASTPQIHVYVKGCHRNLAPDGVRARWHYLYSLTRSEAPCVRLASEEGMWKQRLGIALGVITNFQLSFNQLLVHETGRAYALDGPPRAKNSLGGAILLHGYLW